MDYFTLRSLPILTSSSIRTLFITVLQSNCERNPHVKKSLRFNPTWVLPVSPWAHHVVGPPVGAHRFGPRSVGRIERTLAHVSGARAGGWSSDGTRVHSSVSGESSQCSRFIECVTALCGGGMTSDVMNSAPVPHVTTVNIRDADAAIISSMYRISNEILQHKWLLRQR